MDQRITEIRAIVDRLAAVQTAQKWSDRELVDNYPDLGSTRTWRQRLLASELKDLNLDRTLERLRKVAVILDGGTPDAIYYADMGFAAEMKQRLGLLERQTNDRRILVCLAPNGTGKTSFALNAVAGKRASRAYIRIRPSMRNKHVHLCRGISRALGSDSNCNDANVVEENLISTLRSEPRTIFLDQAHEGGVALMHLLRALVDETPSRFVWLGYETAYRRVLAANTDALIEAQAFMGRCLKPVFDLYKAGTRAGDVTTYIQRAAGIDTNVARSITNRVITPLNRHTNLRLLDDAIQVARAASVNDEPEADRIVAEVYRLAGIEKPTALIQEEE